MAPTGSGPGASGRPRGCRLRGRARAWRRLAKGREAGTGCLCAYFRSHFSSRPPSSSPPSLFWPSSSSLCPCFFNRPELSDTSMCSQASGSDFLAVESATLVIDAVGPGGRAQPAGARRKARAAGRSRRRSEAEPRGGGLCFPASTPSRRPNRSIYRCCNSKLPRRRGEGGGPRRPPPPPRRWRRVCSCERDRPIRGMFCIELCSYPASDFSLLLLLILPLLPPILRLRLSLLPFSSPPLLLLLLLQLLLLVDDVTVAFSAS